MLRHPLALTIIAILLALAGLTLGFRSFHIGPFERGGDTPLGLSLGLDLQGGSHLVYRSALRDLTTGDLIQPTTEQMESLKATIERRVNASGLGEPIIQLLGNDRILVQLPGVRDTERAKSIIGETAQLIWKHRSLNVPRSLNEIETLDIVNVTADFLPKYDSTTDKQEPEQKNLETDIQDSVISDGNQIAEDGTVDLKEATGEDAAGISSSTEPNDVPQETLENAEEEQLVFLLVEFTDEGVVKFESVTERLDKSFQESITGTESGGLVPPSRLDISVQGNEPLRFEVMPYLIQKISDTNLYAFALPQVDTNNNFRGQKGKTETQDLLGNNPKISFTEIQGKIDEDIGLTGDDLARAYPSQHVTSGTPIVNVEFKSRGSKIFGELTRQIAGTNDQVAIFLDDVELISPTVQTAITGGSAIIQGRGFTIERVRDLALLLESGRLPVPISLDQERDVDAILGADSLQKSVTAGMVGLILVLVYMILYYRIPGLVASVSLIIYAGLVLAVFKILPVTLTLSGVAALVLSIGMAVDANILIFERTKDELRSGRTLLSSINAGFNRAWSAIRDGNVSTLITCAILFWFSDQLGVTAVQGFAAALAIGVLISMFSAIVVSKTLLRVLAATPLSKKPGLFVPYGSKDLPQQRHQTVTSSQRSD